MVRSTRASFPEAEIICMLSMVILQDVNNRWKLLTASSEAVVCYSGGY